MPLLFCTKLWAYRIILNSRDRKDISTTLEQITILFSDCAHVITCMSASTSESQKPLLEDSAYDIMHQLEKKADFLYSAVEKYVRDAEKDGKPELIKLWNKIKEDEQNHLKMLREELVKEVKEDKFG